MKLKCSAITHTGNYRYHNEDSLLIGDLIINGLSSEKAIKRELKDPAILGIADGLGGHTAGHIASEIVLFSLRENFKRGVREVKELVNEAKKALDDNLREYPERSGMATTLSFIFFERGEANIGHVGDTRIYRINDGIQLLTKDHTEAWEMYERGIIDYEGIRNYGARNVLTSALIAGSHLNDFEIFTCNVSFNKGDIFLLCSDGFWESFNDEEICEFVKTKTPEDILAEALRRGGYDNISFIICEVEDV